MKTANMKLRERYAFTQHGNARYVGTLVEVGVARAVTSANGWHSWTKRDGCRFTNIVEAPSLGQPPEYLSWPPDFSVVPPQKVLHTEAEEVKFQEQSRAAREVSKNVEDERRRMIAAIAKALGRPTLDTLGGPRFDGVAFDGVAESGYYAGGRWITSGIRLSDDAAAALVRALELIGTRTVEELSK